MRDPLELTAENRAAIVAEFRRQRIHWANEEVESKRTGRKPKSAQAAARKDAAKKLNIEDLEL